MTPIVEAVAERKPDKAKMHHMRVTPAKGGVIVTHHSNAYGDPMGKPIVFGKHEGDKLAAHLLRKAGIPGASEEVGEDEHKEMAHSVTVEE